MKKKAVKKAGRKIVNATKVVIDGIQFQSTLEGTMYKLLRDAGITAGYESVKYIITEAFVYNSECWERSRKTSPEMTDSTKIRKMEYTPDFVAPDESFVIEVKGRPNERFPVVWKMFKKLVNERERPPMLFMPKSKADCEQVIKILKEKGYGHKTS